MVLKIEASANCDKCGVGTPLDTGGCLPDQWMRVQGYANVVNGTTYTVTGDYCPDCIANCTADPLIRGSRINSAGEL